VAAKNIAPKTWGTVRSRDLGRWTAWPAGDKPDARYALSFPLNTSFPPGDGTGNTGNPTMLIFANPHLDGMSMWGAGNTAGVTVIAQYRPRQQPGFYAPILWYSDNDSFSAGSIPYWGAGGLFPQNNSNTGTSHWWEGATDGNDWVDYLGNEFGAATKFPKVAVKDQWYTVGFRATRNNANSKDLTWYLDLPSVANADVINHTITTTGYGESPPPQPQLGIGDAPWYATFQHESLGGDLGKYKLFNGVLTPSNVVAESENMDAIVTSEGASKIWWFKRGFATVDDLICDAGTGRAPVWLDPTKKATLVALP
jgi:hypothetical protein